MGDRRVADRRSPEEGVFRIEKKKMKEYVTIGAIFAILIITIIALTILYLNYKNNYEEIINEDNDYNVIDNESISSENDYYCDLLITGDKSQIKPGETITYELKAENINADTGIVMFESLLDYDSDLFECEIIEDKNSEWTKTSLLENSLTMSRTDLLPSAQNQTIAKLAVKAKDNIEEGLYTINLMDLKFSMDNNKTFSIPDETLDIEILND